MALLKSFNRKRLEYLEIPQDWTYRGEGNCNLVISLPNNGKILHIKKMRRKTTLVWLVTDGFLYLLCFVFFLIYWLYTWITSRESSELQFYKQIMRPLLGEEYVSQVKEVALSRHQIRKLENKLKHLRPEKRMHKTLQPGRATIMDDFALISDDYSSLEMVPDSFAVEIKPKQGWIPLSMKLLPKCVYCMNQYLKLERGDIQRLSSYCPEDFFSGNEFLMLKSIKALIDNPQNNFRIFKNGKLVYGENFPKDDFIKVTKQMFGSGADHWVSLRDEFCNLLKESLTMKLNTSEYGTATCTQRLFCEWDSSTKNSHKLLFKGSVMERILSVQMLDVEGSAYYDELLNEKTKSCGIKYVDKLLDEIKKLDPGLCMKCKIMLLSNTSHCYDDDIDLRCVPYLLSSIANDCSLMVTFRKVKRDIDNRGTSESILHTNYGNFAVRIGIFDLFPKPVSTIKKHTERNNRIFKAYVDNLSLPRRLKHTGKWELQNVCVNNNNNSSQQQSGSGGIVNKIVGSVQNIYRRLIIAEIKND